MKRGIYIKLALDNIRKNTQLYLPRILAEAGLLGCFYILLTMAMDSRVGQAAGGRYLQQILGYGVVVLGLLSFVLILYANSFLMKRRKSEYGLYNVLGLEKRHVIRVLFFESAAVSLLSVPLGLAFGMLFYKMASLFVCRLLQVEAVAGFYYLSAPTVLYSGLLFLAADFIAFLVNSLSIWLLKPADLLSSEHTGEKEPRVRWLVLLAGLAALGAGYSISLTIVDPEESIIEFFKAVILVMIGTYCVYIAGTTFVLKCLKRNRGYYYHPRHMPAVAGLLFRMKRNAMGLASIALLATGVLVMVSTTVSLYSGVQEKIDAYFSQPLYFSAWQGNGLQGDPLSFQELNRMVAEAAEENGAKIDFITETHVLIVTYRMQGDGLVPDQKNGDVDSMEKVRAMFITEETYNQLAKKGLAGAEPLSGSLQKDEIAFCRIQSYVTGPGDVPEKLTIHGKAYRIKEELPVFPVNPAFGENAGVIGIVVADEEVLDTIYLEQKEAYGIFSFRYINRIGVTFADEKAADDAGAKLDQAIIDRYAEAYPGSNQYSLDTKWGRRQDMVEIYGTFLFLGALLGFVSLFSTVLIIFYKQISEGYEDRNRFRIMEKIGMTKREVRQAIGSQLVLQFFLPLFTAAVHTAFAFPLLLKMLKVLLLSNTWLFVVCSVVTLAVFAAVYTVVYFMTAKIYYRIVHQRQ